jgi:NAD-dependent DNA ligase
VVILPLPPEAAGKARRVARRLAAKARYKPSQTGIEMAGYLVLLTSLAPNDWPPERLASTYRLRWQIELAFKRMKSLVGLEDLRAKDPDLARLLIALGIRHVGSETAAALATTFGSLERLLSASLEELQATSGVGNVAGASVHAWFQDEQSRAMVERMLARGVRPRARQRSSGPLEGKTFVITGTLSQPRPAVAARIEAAGGKVVGAVSKKIDYLVVGESPGSKVDQARKAGVAIVDEPALEALLAGQAPPAEASDEAAQAALPL